MKFLRVLRVLSSQIPKPQFNSPVILSRFYSAQLEQEDPTIYKDENHDGVFDSSQFEIPSLDSVDSGKQEPTWDEKFRDRADRKLFGKKIDIKSNTKVVEREQQKRQRAANLARTLLEAALDGKNEEDENEIDSLSVKEEDQKSLSVGIIGAPNAGKSALTNFMFGTKVAAVSRKTNTTTHEVLGVMTKGQTQICFFDTPGLTLNRGGYPSKDVKVRVESAWSAVDLYDLLIVIFDVHRHLNRPDSRVVRLIKRMGSEVNPKQKRILCMNKVDLVEKKKDLLKVAEQFKDLPAYERVPNAIDGRESTDIEIYGMQGIPADAKAAHVGEEGETALSKILKVDVPSPQVVGAVVSGPIAIQYPLSMNHPVYNPAAPLAPAGWPVPPHPQPWFTHHSATSVPPPGSLGLVQQPLFPVQNLQSPVPSTAPPGIQPSISNGPPGLHPSMPLVAVSQPLFPVVSNSGVLEYSSTFSAPTLSTSVPPNPSEISSSIPLPTSTNLSLSNSYQGILHSYASEPNTDGPSIGPPPMIANKAPQPAIYEVYLIWEDEAMSMEERRMSLKKYQVHDETTQISSVNAAIDRKISESALASRMAF